MIFHAAYDVCKTMVKISGVGDKEKGNCEEELE